MSPNSLSDCLEMAPKLPSDLGPLSALAPLLSSASGASAHDVGSTSDPVPARVKKACCGPEDVHHLTADQIHLTPADWRVEGYPDLIPIGKELPSPDGDYWVFFRTLYNGDKSIVYFFFTPFDGTQNTDRRSLRASPETAWNGEGRGRPCDSCRLQPLLGKMTTRVGFNLEMSRYLH